MRSVVVGLDGTDVSANALTWAASVVGPEGTIHAVLALDPVAEYVVDVVTRDRDSFRQRLQWDLENEWIEPIRGRVGRLTASTAELDASTALAVAADELDADAIVIGAHAVHEGLPRRIGSTIKHLLRELACPLVIVPADTTGGFDSARPVVVGIGQGAATEAAVRWAAHFADEREVTVALVHATGDPAVVESDGIGDLLERYVRRGGAEGSRAEDIVRWAGEVQERSEHELDIRTSEPSGLSTVRLAEASEVASVLVVGRHRSKFPLGRHTSQPLRYELTHSMCPLVVVPEEPATSDGTAAPDETDVSEASQTDSCE